MADEEVKEEVKEEAKEEKKEEAPKYTYDQLNNMTVTKLRELAKSVQGIPGSHAMKKEEILQEFKRIWRLSDEGVVYKKDNSEYKGKIRELRNSQTEARSAKDRKKSEIIRKKIKRLKRKTRIV